jgi:hypothetical protein
MNQKHERNVKPVIFLNNKFWTTPPFLSWRW